MIVEKTMYTVKCDGCGKEAGEDCEIVAWTDKFSAELRAIDDHGFTLWDHNRLTPGGEKHYCPDCVIWDEENDKAVLKEKE